MTLIMRITVSNNVRMIFEKMISGDLPIKQICNLYLVVVRKEMMSWQVENMD
jgi:hypothetical protein